MNIRKWNNFGDLPELLRNSLSTWSYDVFDNGKWYDPEKYELKPREDYKKKLIKEIEEEIEANEKYFRKRDKQLREELEKVKD